MAASTADHLPGVVITDCADFLAFQELLKKSRDIDDKIIYALNKSIPTQSFQGQVDATSTCKGLYSKLRESYDIRGKAIVRCVEQTRTRVEALQKQRENAHDSYEVLKDLRREQSKLRLYRSELSVEEVVRDRSEKAVSERCRLFYTPGPGDQLTNANRL